MNGLSFSFKVDWILALPQFLKRFSETCSLWSWDVFCLLKLLCNLACHVALQPCMSCCCPTLHVMLLSNLARHVAFQPCMSCCCHMSVPHCLRSYRIWYNYCPYTLCLRETSCWVRSSFWYSWVIYLLFDRLNNFYCTLLECSYIFWRCRSWQLFAYATRL